MSKPTIVITAGHGARDPGAVNPRLNVTEAALMVSMRNALAKCLRDKGFNVVTDGEGGTNLPLTEAIRLIRKGAIAIELHLNASANPRVDGVEAIGTPRQRRICQDLCRVISEELNIPLRRDAGYFDYAKTGRRLGFVSAGGIIMEAFFVTNDASVVKFTKEKMWPIVRRMADVIDNYY